MTTAEAPEYVRRLELRGAVAQVLTSQAEEILVDGPAGTGKTRGLLEVLHRRCMQHAGIRGLILRKHRVTLSSTCLVTFNEQVIDWEHDGVVYFGGSDKEPASYRYANGSRIVVGGMDNASKILSSEYDWIYVNEATELTEPDWETLTTRLRNNVYPGPLQLIADCNPANEKHWLNQRCDRGATQRLRSVITDNPAYYTIDEFGDAHITPAGRTYLHRLARLTGNQRLRLFEGRWVGMEHVIYGHFDRGIHVRPLEEGLRFRDSAFGADYGRRHKSSVVAVQVDQYGRRWVREAWAAPDEDHGNDTARQVGIFKERYSLRRGKVDPNEDVLIGLIGKLLGNEKLVTPVELAEGPRQARIDIMGRLLNVFPGGRVPTLREELAGTYALGPWGEPDSPGLILVAGAPGIDELCNEIENYHYDVVESDRRYVEDVHRVDDDYVAALEDALLALDEPIGGFDINERTVEVLKPFKYGRPESRNVRVLDRGGF